jgi:hypothetical protein
VGPRELRGKMLGLAGTVMIYCPGWRAMLVGSASVCGFAEGRWPMLVLSPYHSDAVQITMTRGGPMRALSSQILARERGAALLQQWYNSPQQRYLASLWRGTRVSLFESVARIKQGGGPVCGSMDAIIFPGVEH